VVNKHLEIKMIDELINKFIQKIENNEIELYNEAGLQHELGYFLRCNNVNTKFEYNTNLIPIIDDKLLKKELDLYIRVNEEQYCIELKFPTKGAFPRRMTQSLIDIFFIQQLLNNGFTKGYFLFFTTLSAFKQGPETNGIYSYFRRTKSLSEFCCQDIPQFMLEKEAKKLFSLLNSRNIILDNNYFIEFKTLSNRAISYYYFLLKINS
jgi:hypothetical protein